MITCTFEDKGKAHLRHVTVNAVVVKEDKVLLGKRGTYGNGKPLLEAGKYALLGGFFDRDESLEQALKREIYEESGWEIDNLSLLRINDDPKRPYEDRQNVDIIFIAEAIKQTGRPDEEVSHLKWFSLNDLPPEDMIAFDHYDSLIIYKMFLDKKIVLPLTGPFRNK
jgi:ADP-ribose pyrophosphatase YjhB (NUDIX family)